ncbi:hypothetical protein Y1Q_0011605 [Alligator mississippiensis]|uniref:Uncharacterized protein n=1 Tax=Alligator mississippiensis TaxID=8496 RepID=A0A151M0I3_ALLMI|nr:hypothetical protein Y1Q_0011605 [Alligator mississippiensis]
MDPGSIGMLDPLWEALREEDTLDKESEEAPDASCGNSGRKQITNAGDKPEAAPAICQGSIIRRSSEGHAKTLTITGGSSGSSGEEEEFSPLGESQQEQQEGPQRSGALTLNTENSQPHTEELRGTRIGTLQKGEKRGSIRLTKEMERGEGTT